MTKAILSYREFIKAEFASVQNEEDSPKKIERASLLENYHYRQITCFQHERLIHLIVTFFFACMFLLFFFASLFGIQSLVILIVTAILLIVTIFYIWHYYFLENSIQSLYALNGEFYMLTATIKKNES